MSAVMVATSSKTKEKNSAVETQEWTKLFPRQVTQSYTNSLKFMKQLTAIAFSTITFLKHLFPEENYLTKTFDGLKLKILKTKCIDELAQNASTALVNSFDPLDKKYLEKLVLCLYEGAAHPDNLMETYALSFTYAPARVCVQGAGGRPAAGWDEADVRTRTLQLLRACMDATRPDSAPSSSQYNLTIRLYYNEKAPSWYQAPGFEVEADDGGVEAALEEQSPFAAVRTPYHRFALAACVRQDINSEEANASVTIPTFTEEDVDNICNMMDERKVRCECGRDDDAEDMLTCNECGYMQHAACYGVRRGVALAQHYCLPCTAPHRPPSCDHVAGLSVRHREAFCLYRRALAWCSEHAHVSEAGLRDTLHMSEVGARRLVATLHAQAVLPATQGVQKINHDKLESLLQKHFRSDENSVVERLMAETLSQNTAVDPIQKGLRPDERSSLRTAAAAEPGQLTSYSPPEQNQDDLDSTLERYREAVQQYTDDNRGDQLPLSGKHNPVQKVEHKESKIGKRKISDTEKLPAKSRLATKKSKLIMAKKGQNSK